MNGDLTDGEWEIIVFIFMCVNKGRLFQKHSKCELVNAVRYISKTGSQWCLLWKVYLLRFWLIKEKVVLCEKICLFNWKCYMPCFRRRYVG